MDYKLLALDMDGTTLNSSGLVSPRTRLAIERAYDQGVKVALVSGRPPYSLREIADGLGIKGIMAAMNGNIVFDNREDRYMEHYTLDYPMVLKMIGISYKERDCLLMLSIGDLTVIENRDHEFLPLMKQFFQEGLTLVDDLVQYLEDMDYTDKVNKLAFIQEYERLLDIRDGSLSQYREDLSQVFTLPFCLELFRKDVNKYEAVKAICKNLEIGMEKVMAIGDGENDIEMLKHAGLGIATANCMPGLIPYADEITSTNDRDGVAKAIEKYILKTLDKI